MTGWRIGYTIANEEWTQRDRQTAKPFGDASDQLRAIRLRRARCDRREESMASVETMLAEYRRRRDWLIPALQGIDGFRCAMPEGAFYAFVDVREMLGERFKNSGEVAECLLQEAQTVVTDGAGFGADGFLRFSYATSLENLQKAVERIRSVFASKTTRTA